MTRRVAYADPPYLGMCKAYQHRHEGVYGCWDDLDTHRTLFGVLDGYDAWAVSLGSKSLREILPLAPPDSRVAAWVKPFCSFKPNVNPAYAWEPVIFKAPNRPGTFPTTRDYCEASMALKRGFFGAKPRDFCLWLFELIGMQPGDEFVDLFPGSGGVTAAWEEWAARKRTGYVVTGPLFAESSP